VKRGRVGRALSLYSALEALPVSGTEAADPIVAYRTRAKLVVGPRGELGLFARGGEHEVVDIPRCRVIAPVLSRVADALRARIAADARSHGPLSPAGSEHGGALRAVDLREVRHDGPIARMRAIEGSTALLTLVFDRDAAPSRSALEGAARSLVSSVPEVAGVAASFQRSDAPQVLGSETIHLAGVQAASDRAGASRVVATFGSFVQAHRGQAAKIHAMVADAVRSLGAAPRVLDLYGGSGAIALGLAAAGAQVLLVESFAPAVAQAEAAAREQGLPLRARHADVARGIEESLRSREAFDAVVLNPPRRGASPEVREGIARLAPQIIVYASCDPSTLARDLDHLARLGYVAPAVSPFDMIPLSEEVETVAVLRRGDPPAPRVLYEDDSIVAVLKSAHERVQTLRGVEGARPVLTLDDDASGVVIHARTEALVAPWRAALASPSSRVTFVVGARGVLRAKGSVVRQLRGPRSRPTRIRYVRTSVFGGHSLARVTEEPASGDSARNHLAAIDHPVLGDPRRCDRATIRHFTEKAGLDRVFLHRERIELDPPGGGPRIVIEAPLAGDLQAVLDRYAR
jgi:23S rRNA (uracil1939-C5)-methyltransferase